MRLTMRGVQVLRRSNRPGSQFLSTGTENFGYQKVGVGEKEEKVKGVFASVASNYDVMNDLMSVWSLDVDQRRRSSSSLMESERPFFWSSFTKRVFCSN